jgi:hypothetical protein
MSPIKNDRKRKTVVTDAAGSKHVVAMDDNTG